MGPKRYLLGTMAALLVGSLALSAQAGELVSYKVEDDQIKQSLTGKPGDAVAGRKTAINRKKGNCLSCHKMPIPKQPFHGNVGPDLAGIGARMSAGEMRLRIVNPKAVNEATIMPGFYRTDNLHRVQKKWKGKTIIGAQDVEDIIAYLLTLK